MPINVDFELEKYSQRHQSNRQITPINLPSILTSIEHVSDTKQRHAGSIVILRGVKRFVSRIHNRDADAILDREAI